MEDFKNIGKKVKEKTISNTKEYRDGLAEDLQTIRSIDPDVAQEFLSEKKETEEYQEARAEILYARDNSFDEQREENGLKEKKRQEIIEMKNECINNFKEILEADISTPEKRDEVYKKLKSYRDDYLNALPDYKRSLIGPLVEQTQDFLPEYFRDTPLGRGLAFDKEQLARIDEEDKNKIEVLQKYFRAEDLYGAFFTPNLLRIKDDGEYHKIKGGIFFKEEILPSIELYDKASRINTNGDLIVNFINNRKRLLSNDCLYMTGCQGASDRPNRQPQMFPQKDQKDIFMALFDARMDFYVGQFKDMKLEDFSQEEIQRVKDYYQKIQDFSIRGKEIQAKEAVKENEGEFLQIKRFFENEENTHLKLKAEWFLKKFGILEKK